MRTVKMERGARGMTETAFEAMVVQYEKLVYSVCFQLVRDAHTAEDLTQETFLAAWTHRDACPDAPRAWLCRIAANKAKDHLKCAHTRRSTLMADEMMAAFESAAASVEETVHLRGEAEKAARAVRSLPRTYRETGALFFLGGLSAREIALRTNRPARTVQTQVYRARLILKKELCAAG